MPKGRVRGFYATQRVRTLCVSKFGRWCCCTPGWKRIATRAIQMTRPEPIRVCAFTYYFPPHFSGAGLYALSLAKELASRGVQLFFVTVDNTHLPRVDRQQGFDVYRSADGPRKHGELLLWWNLWRKLFSKRNRFDIIHAFGSTY